MKLRDSLISTFFPRVTHSIKVVSFNFELRTTECCELLFIVNI